MYFVNQSLLFQFLNGLLNLFLYRAYNSYTHTLVVKNLTLNALILVLITLWLSIGQFYLDFFEKVIMDIFKNHLGDDDKAYPGNIWGWKFSFISLGIIVVLGGLAIYRYSTLDNPPPIFQEEQPVTQDSVEIPLPENK